VSWTCATHLRISLTIRYRMPTFLIFQGSAVTQTLRGASAPALTNAVAKAVDAAGGAGTGASFGSKGYRLGDAPADSKKPVTSPAASKASASGTGSGGRKLGAQGTAAGAGASMLPDLGQAASSVTRFMGLYLVTLFSLDPFTAAQNSPLSVNQARR
jgi:thioredoxin 1